MRVERSPVSAHQAGMSALWHDADYVPEQRFETPLVRKGLEDMALPTEQHQLPPGVDDPFKKMEAMFDVAAEQMERGLKGTAFLHGKPPPTDALENARHAEDITRTMHAAPHKGSPVDRKIVESVRTDLDQMRLTNEAAAKPIVSSKGATPTAADAEAEKGAPNISSVGGAAVATFLPAAASHAITSVVQGPLPALASQAITTAGSVMSAGQIVAAGVAEGLRESEPVVPRRGLRPSSTGGGAGDIGVIGDTGDTRTDKK